MKLSDMTKMQQSAVRNYFSYVLYRNERKCMHCGSIEEPLLVVYKDPTLVSIDRQNLDVVCRKCYSNQPHVLNKIFGKRNPDSDLVLAIEQDLADGLPHRRIMNKHNISRYMLNRIVKHDY